MNLLPNHLTDLRKSGLNDETIGAADIYSESDHQKLAALLNRRSWPRNYGSGLVFPFHDEAGAVVLTRIKPDHPPRKGGKWAKYLQPSGVPVRVYVPTEINGALQDIERVLLIPVPDDKCPTWEECEEPGEPCEACGSLEYWADLLGNRYCQQCHPPKLGLAHRLRYKAAKLRERKVAPF